MKDSEYPAIALVTIWYRAAEAIDRYIANLKNLDYPSITPVLVIHQQSRQEVDRLRANVPGALILEPGGNLGSAAGWNLAIRRLLTGNEVAYVGIWNVDVTLDARCPKHLVATMEADTSIGACQPLIFFADEPAVVQMYGGTLDLSSGQGSHDYQGTVDLHRLPPVRDAQYLDGGTMLIRSEVLRRAGVFDENFFMYSEDSDLSVRIRKAGYRTVAVRDAWAWHHHGSSQGELPRPYQLFYETRNRFHLVRKHGSWATWLRLVVETSLRSPRNLFYFLRRRKLDLVCAYAVGFASGVAGMMGKQGWVD